MDIDVFAELSELGIDWEEGKTIVEMDTPNVEPYSTAESLPSDTYDYLASRGAKYGIEVQDMLDKVPDVLKHHPKLIEVFVSSKDISHFVATSVGGSPDSPDNWDYEDEGPNSKRQANKATSDDILAMKVDNNYDAHVLMDLVYSNVLDMNTLCDNADIVETVMESVHPMTNGWDLIKVASMYGVAIV